MSSPRGATMKEAILVVDDDVSFANLVSELLQEQGFRIDTAADHAQALDRVSHSDYAVAVVDLVLPGVGGLELADLIKTASPDTQVLILTGHGSLPSAIAGLRHGIFDYLQKAEVDFNRLTRAVSGAAERWRLLRENRELIEGVRESNRRLRVLQQVTARLAAEEHVDRLLAVLLDSARQLCRADRGRVLLFDRSHAGTLVVEHAAGEGGEAMRGVRLHPDEGIAARAAATSETFLVMRPTEHPAYSSRSDDLGSEASGLLCVPLRHGAVTGALLVSGRPQPFEAEDLALLASLGRQAAIAVEAALERERSINFFAHTCDLLVGFLDTVDVLLPGHSRAVAGLADMVSRRLGLPEAERRNIHFAALLHDIGKVKLDPELLRFEEGPTDETVGLFREHPTLGVEMLKPITAWEGILPLIQTHHERWDGAGYPSGMAGEDIPLGGRIIAVADAFDAMTRIGGSRRPRSPSEALAELEANAGTQFDPRVVRLFVAEYRERPPE